MSSKFDITKLLGQSPALLACCLLTYLGVQWLRDDWDPTSSVISASVLLGGLLHLAIRFARRLRGVEKTMVLTLTGLGLLGMTACQPRTQPILGSLDLASEQAPSVRISKEILVTATGAFPKAESHGVLEFVNRVDPKADFGLYTYVFSTLNLDACKDKEAKCANTVQLLQILDRDGYLLKPGATAYDPDHATMNAFCVPVRSMKGQTGESLKERYDGQAAHRVVQKLSKVCSDSEVTRALKRNQGPFLVTFAKPFEAYRPGETFLFLDLSNTHHDVVEGYVRAYKSELDKGTTTGETVLSAWRLKLADFILKGTDVVVSIREAQAK
ncbi:hypothetical protein NNJEOMEG_00988 [Fundidesulfovibrio magnetotacticus]|uniref:Uncharacterized protein n=1 Tax=Fundidesulfovibrio magnetotacticus TaxID=2730080 RepID=A0A6V8LU35_9BACT|nr:hypothetical protein [Fundidesulfovibrio magnetotacticus]GFK93157.1 hypothetical protein NNJEOMEG_00988 [Fundidesulfovibrio magnetotacticus]